MKSAQQQTVALEQILLQLQLYASKISDTDFKKFGAKDLMTSIQDCKRLIELSKELSIYETIQQHTDSLQDYGSCLGLRNM